MPPKKAAKSKAAASKAPVQKSAPKKATKPAAPDLPDDDADNTEDSSSSDDLDLNDEEAVQVLAPHPEQNDELPARLIPFLGDNKVTDFLRYKILKRKRDPEDALQSGTKRTKRTKVTKSLEYDDEWVPQTLLGFGSFGQVAMWAKKDSDGTVIDEIAVKEAHYEQHYAWSDRSGLSSEAVMTHHVNKSKVDNFVQLRGFKCFIGRARNRFGTVPSTAKWLYYLEYAPHGDLTRLIKRYRAWDQYLPEEFLWHAFDSLAKAIYTIAELETKQEELPRQFGHEAKDIGDDARIIHFDIKPDNIFLANPTTRSPENKDRGGLSSGVYPILKLGDFGVAEFVEGRINKTNPRQYWGTGTPYYMPPEQKLYGIMWENPPNYQTRIDPQRDSGDFMDNQDIEEEIEDKDKDFHFTQAMNVWNVGKTMYDLVSLSRKWAYARASTQKQDEYEQNDRNAIADFATVPFRIADDPIVPSSQSSSRNSPYSAELTDLIEECLKPAVEDRISAQDLFARTQAEVSSWEFEDDDDDETLSTLPKLFFRQNEINGMELGVNRFPIYNGGYENGVNENSDIISLLDAILDPDWEDLELPDPKWTTQVNHWKTQRAKAEAEAKQPDIDIANGMINFGGKVKRGNKVAKAVKKPTPAVPAAPVASVKPVKPAPAKVPDPPAIVPGSPKQRPKRVQKPTAKVAKAQGAAASSQAKPAKPAAAKKPKSKAQAAALDPKKKDNAAKKPVKQNKPLPKLPPVITEDDAEDDNEDDGDVNDGDGGDGGSVGIASSPEPVPTKKPKTQKKPANPAKPAAPAKQPKAQPKAQAKKPKPPAPAKATKQPAKVTKKPAKKPARKTKVDDKVYKQQVEDDEVEETKASPPAAANRAKKSKTPAAKPKKAKK